MKPQQPVLEVTGLLKTFHDRGHRNVVHAVNGLNFSIARGEAFGLAGESGCGKSTTASLLMGLVEPTGGDVRFHGKPVIGLSRAARKAFYRKVQMIFQDPYGSLNPRKTIGSILALPFQVHEPAPAEKIRTRVLALLESVELKPAESFLHRYPHELSGGQRQRLAIARAIALRPELVISDEAVAALDMSVRADILNLLKSVKDSSGASFLMISHDLSVLRAMCDRIAIMYLGRFVEVAETESLFTNPRHPYTRALLSATLLPNPRAEQARERIVLKGDPTTSGDTSTGCAFRFRCSLAERRCETLTPHLQQISVDHQVSCHVTAGEGNMTAPGMSDPSNGIGAKHVQP